MGNVHGWTALAGAVVALAGGATTAQGAAAARPRQQPKPALAVGRSADSSWRLEGRRLTVRLASPLLAPSRDRRVRVIVRCGDGVVQAVDSIAEGRSFFARAAAADGWFAPTARTLRLRLAADVANAATYCKLEDWQYDGDVPTRGAWMRSLRGSAPRCVPLRGERVVHRSPTALVLARKADSASVEEGEVLRACLKPNGRSVGIAEDWDGGGGAGGSVNSGGYVSAGRWLAWRGSWSYHAPGAGGGGSVLLRDLAVGGRPSATVAFDASAFHGLSTHGTVVFSGAVGEQSALLAGLPDGRTIELGRAAPGGQIDQVVLSRDGTTVSWRDGASTRAAAVPASAQSARPDVSTGDDGAGTSFRLEGSRLTLTLPARAVARTARSATVVCGNALGTPVRSDDPASTLYAARVEQVLRVPAGARTASAAVGVDVARWVSDCTLHWNADGRPWLEPTARMRLRRGTAPGCELPPGARVVVAGDGTLVVAAGPVRPDGSSYTRYSGCAKPAGAWRLLEEHGSSPGRPGPELRFATAGAWVGWSRRDLPPDVSSYPCALRRVDLAAPAGSAWPDLAPAPDPRPAGFCPTAPAIGSDGTMAWVARGWEAPSWDAPMQLNVAGPGGAITTLDTAAKADATSALPFADLAVDAAARTVRWRNGAQPRSAPLPTP